MSQMTLNVLWSVAFFGFRNPLAAFVEIVGLWLTILATITSFRPISRPASLLLYPYFAWVSFAGVLNLSIVILN
jgi:translocator protein